MIVMDSKAQLTVDIIAKVVEGRITIANAAKLLSKSRRTIERYVKQYQQVGIQFAVHGNSGKAPPNKTLFLLHASQIAFLKSIIRFY
jgi:transposase